MGGGPGEAGGPRPNTQMLAQLLLQSAPVKGSSTDNERFHVTGRYLILRSKISSPVTLLTKYVKLTPNEIKCSLRSK